VLIALIAARRTDSRRTAFTATLLLALTPLASAAFLSDYIHFFDGLVLMFVLLAVWLRRFWPAAVLFLLALWTDERAILAIGTAALIPLAGRLPTGLRTLARQPLWQAAALALVLTLAGRAILAGVYGLRLPTGDAAGVGPAILTDNFAHWPYAWVLGLESAWVLVAGGLSATWAMGRRGWALLILGGLVAYILASHLVLDITRSMTYLMPLVLWALGAIHAAAPRWLPRRLGLLALAAAFIPTVFFIQGAIWSYPLPLMLLVWLRVLGMV
jgi:hypothetical protein